jgi:putative inorganic carbon (HCO3(-)) transporter
MFRAAARYLPPSLENSWERAAFLLLAGSVSLVLVSIAASQILLAGAILAALAPRKRHSPIAALPWAIALPAILLFGWTVLAVLVNSGSPDAAMIKKFFLFSLLVLVPRIAAGHDKSAWIYRSVFAVAAVSSLAGVIQFVANPERDALHRIQGFLSIWMTYSGSLMLVLVALVAFAATVGWKRQPWVIPLGIVMLAALYLSQTRSAWLGVCAGACVILLLKKPRALIALPLLLLALYLASPARIQQRLVSAWNPADDNTRNRIELFGTALRLIRDHPWIGVGQNVSRVAPAYRGTPEFPDWMYLHLHNNFLQVAAERGIPGLLLWIWFMAQLGWHAFRACRASPDCGVNGKQAPSASAAFVAAAAVGGWVAMLVAGMFEYNYGDSEVLTMFLFMMSAPLAFPAGSRAPSDVP